MGADQSQILESLTDRNYVTFMINGLKYMVDPSKDKITAGSRLVDFIRDHANLKGTKYMCREGGCGACTVTVKTRNPFTGQEIIRGINSCLVPVFACDGWEIMTVEFLGNQKEGYHPLQQRFVVCHGTQCGFCTPGWIMNFYSMMESKKQFTVADIHDRIDGNICRCTGFRPILDAVKSFAVDASEELKRKCGDSRSCESCPLRAKSPAALTSANVVEAEFEQLELPSSIHLNISSNSQWVKAVDIKTLFMALTKFQNYGLKYRIVGGNTGMGVFKNEGPYQAYVELMSIPALTKIDSLDSSIIFGGGVTITQAIETLEKASSVSGFEYCKHVCKHWKRVANISVRNAGTLAGNLMLKHDHKEFQSDIFLVLETIGAMLTIASSPSLQNMWTVEDFLNMNMQGKIIYSVHLPALKNMTFRSFKISRRYQNAHAYVNAGFLMQIDPMNMYVKMRPRIVLGGISPSFVHASMTEEYLVGKTLNPQIMQGAVQMLEREVNPNMDPMEGDSMYRKKLSQALFYKVMLEILDGQVSPRMKSGSTDLEHGPSYGKQMYGTDKSEWPMYEPVAKLEAPFQCSGEAEYTNDIGPLPGELHGAVVHARFANCMLKGVDPSAALGMAGVVAWIDHSNIPAMNNYMYSYGNDEDVIFVKDKIRFAGEVIGMILAESRELAYKAVSMVEVYYQNREKPILDIPSALEKAEKEGKLSECIVTIRKPTEDPIKDAPNNISGEFHTGGQYHFHMETQVAICVPKEGCMDVYSATQTASFTQFAVANCLGVSCSSINVYVRRLGGGFGGKISRSNHIASMCAVAANTLRRPVRLSLDLEGNMGLVGGRSPYLYKYQAGFDDTGKIMNINIELVNDCGSSQNEPTITIAEWAIQNVYAANSSWGFTTKMVRTNLPPNTYCRSPGYPKSLGFMECVMEHVAAHLKKDPMEVRMVNLLKKGDTMFPDTSQKLEEDNLVPILMQDLERFMPIKGLSTI
ncbi:unnamed protein product [Allacma fusca]|uniref:Aldehyde oxidase n=1 Tax=Allacma fusca TaxID=39272 RepID=A0A8J2NJN2_9HEXA|nr:unnamed protein product [Allacma fusca]